jgi:hydroxyacylglutathione hydrolase
MRQWKTKNGYVVYKVLAGRSNAYLISAEIGNILVDTGNKSSYDCMRRNIDSLKLTQKVRLLILTHTHYDHCQNVPKIREKENCDILMSEREAKFAHCGYTPLPKGTFSITKIISYCGSLIGQRKFGYQSFTPDRLVGEELDLLQDGYKIKIVSTYGHSEGSVSVIIDNEIAIVGDAMLGTFRNSIFPPFADDIVGMINSWGKLLGTNCYLFLPGHGKEITRHLLQKEYAKCAKKYNIP